MSTDARFARIFAFVLDNGDVVYPMRIRDRDTGITAFKISNRGNTNLDAKLVEDEGVLADLVLNRGFRVRCSTRDGSRDGLYSPKGHTVVEIKRFT